LVEAPGTAPGSTTIIPRAVYHHSQQADAARCKRKHGWVQARSFRSANQAATIDAMVATDTVIPAAWPELARLAWNRDPTRPIPGAEALDLYEANWRHVDQTALTQEERALIRTLADRYGCGHLLTTK
jgi:hypothetical protein